MSRIEDKNTCGYTTEEYAIQPNNGFSGYLINSKGIYLKDIYKILCGTKPLHVPDGKIDTSKWCHYMHEGGMGPNFHLCREYVHYEKDYIYEEFYRPIYTEKDLPEWTEISYDEEDEEE